MRPVRVVVLGAAAHIFGAAHVGALSAVGADVVGVFDAQQHLAERLGARYGWPVYSDVDRLLTVSADVAVVTAPHPEHAELVGACLRADKHVLVEKPLGVSVGEADTLIRESERRGRTLAVVLQHRLRREVRYARELLRDGAIGALHRADLVACYPKRSRYYTERPWRGTWSGAGGGVLLNQGQHYLDMLTYLVGLPHSVFAWTSTRVQPMETEDTVEAAVQWADGGTGSVHVTSAADGPRRLELTGTAGRIRLSEDGIEVTTCDEDIRTFARSPGDPFDHPRERERRIIPGGDGTHTDLYRDLVDTLDGEREPVGAARDAVGAVELTNAVTLSAHRAAPVKLPVDRDEYAALLTSLRSGEHGGVTTAGAADDSRPWDVSRGRQGSQQGTREGASQ